ncbi:MAG TPA: phosphonate utilization associated transcriptional regulator [Casimicrobiaceae bacterium]|nr:phosphonate utilization associated transcriptional regulator [Casimicrobiaceae bacterium]
MLKPVARAGATTGARPASGRPPRDAVAPEDHPRDTIHLVRSNSLPALVQRELERMILAGELGAGAKINEADIAQRLGVSRGPVREAFRALEETGLVRLEKNRGVFVRQVSVREADEIYELRAVLDEFVGRRLAETATPAQVRELRQLQERMEKASARNDVDTYLDANVEFHDRMVEHTGNGKLLQIYRRLVNELHLFRRANLTQGGVLPVSSREHREIVDRIAARQVAAAGRALHEHATASRNRMHKTYGETATAESLSPRRAARGR